MRFLGMNYLFIMMVFGCLGNTCVHTFNEIGKTNRFIANWLDRKPKEKKNKQTLDTFQVIPTHILKMVDNKLMSASKYI